MITFSGRRGKMSNFYLRRIFHCHDPLASKGPDHLFSFFSQEITYQTENSKNERIQIYFLYLFSLLARFFSNESASIPQKANVITVKRMSERPRGNICRNLILMGKNVSEALARNCGKRIYCAVIRL